MPKYKRRIHLRFAWILLCALILAGSAAMWGWYRAYTLRQVQELTTAAQQSASDFFSIFGEEGLIPIVRPGAQEIGGVYNPRTHRWVYEASTCFPALKTKAAVSSTLPNIILKHAEDSSVALGFDKVLSALIGTTVIRSTIVTFTDVTVQDTPEYSFREAYSPQKCPELGAIIDSVYSGEPTAKPVEPLLILGTLYRAKRTVTIDLIDQAHASEILDAIKGAITVNGRVASNSIGHASIILENDLVLPVAAMPAFIPTPTGVNLGAGQPSTRTIWFPFDPTLNPHAIEILKQISEQAAQ